MHVVPNPSSLSLIREASCKMYTVLLDRVVCSVDQSREAAQQSKRTHMFTKCQLRARHSARCCHFFPLLQLSINTVGIPILQMRKQRPRRGVYFPEVTVLASVTT